MRVLTLLHEEVGAVAGGSLRRLRTKAAKDRRFSLELPAPRVLSWQKKEIKKKAWPKNYTISLNYFFRCPKQSRKETLKKVKKYSPVVTAWMPQKFQKFRRMFRSVDDQRFQVRWFRVGGSRATEGKKAIHEARSQFPPHHPSDKLQWKRSSESHAHSHFYLNF